MLLVGGSTVLMVTYYTGSSKYRHTTPKCRIHVSMEGFEWFMYNRTATFEHILSQMTGTTAQGVRSRESNNPSLNPSVNERGLGAYSGRQQFPCLANIPTFAYSLYRSSENGMDAALTRVCHTHGFMVSTSTSGLESDEFAAG